MRTFNIVLAVVIVLGAVLLSTVGADAMRGLQAVYLSVVAPLLKAGSAVTEQVGSVGGKIKTLDQLEAENRDLTLQNRELLATNQMLRDLEAENNQLRAALGYRERSVFKLLPALVLSRDASTWWNTVKINRGFEEGVESDMPVVTEAGLVGKTTTVGKNESIVVLLTDETCRVAARVEGSVEQGIVSGVRLPPASGSGEVQLNFLSKTANLQPGQKVYTAGVTGGVFPSGILLGDVASFRVRPLDGQAVLRPAVDLSTIADVFVIVGVK